MGKGRVPLSARERNGMIALYTIGITLIGGGFLVRQCRTGGTPPGVVATSDTDTIDIYGKTDSGDAAYIHHSTKRSAKDGSATSNSKESASAKSKKQHRDTTASPAKGTKKSKAKKRRSTPKPPPPQRHHLQEDLSQP